MSYRHDQTRKGRRALTAGRLRWLIYRDTRWCLRHGVTAARAHLYNRRCDESIAPLPGGARA